jgi:hypothetical protein
MLPQRQPDGTYLVPSRTEPGKRYRVVLWPAVQCSCWSFRMNKGTICAHLEAALEHDHTYTNRLGNLCGAGEPGHLEHTLAITEADRQAQRLS